MFADVGAGYGYYRPHIQMFDPAWREDDTVGSRGKHPMAVIKRLASHTQLCPSQFSVQTRKLTMQGGIATEDSWLVALHLHCYACEMLLVIMNGTRQLIFPSGSLCDSRKICAIKRTLAQQCL